MSSTRKKTTFRLTGFLRMNDKQIEYNSQFMDHFATKTANIFGFDLLVSTIRTISNSCSTIRSQPTHESYPFQRRGKECSQSLYCRLRSQSVQVCVFSQDSR